MIKNKRGNSQKTVDTWILYEVLLEMKQLTYNFHYNKILLEPRFLKLFKSFDSLNPLKMTLNVLFLCHRFKRTCWQFRTFRSEKFCSTSSCLMMFTISSVSSLRTQLFSTEWRHKRRMNFATLASLLGGKIKVGKWRISSRKGFCFPTI